MMKQKRLLNMALAGQNCQRPPIWFMRQAGRYHAHYQALRKDHGFMQLCKNPDLACDVTLGPIDEFGFDSAILFSDLLFPLEALGMGLKYDPAPACDWYFKESSDLAKFAPTPTPEQFFSFQGEALQNIRQKLAPETGLIGFVGTFLTLFFYASSGSHKGPLGNAHRGLHDGRFRDFSEKLLPILYANVKMQASQDIDALAFFDTCAGEIDPETFRKVVVPPLKDFFEKVKQDFNVPILYYSLGTNASHWEALEDLPISALGIDWTHDINPVLQRYKGKWAIQGNINPYWLTLPPDKMQPLVEGYFNKIQSLPSDDLKGWICGLGHGVTPEALETNVKKIVTLQKEFFG